MASSSFLPSSPNLDRGIVAIGQGWEESWGGKVIQPKYRDLRGIVEMDGIFCRSFYCCRSHRVWVGSRPLSNGTYGMDRCSMKGWIGGKLPILRACILSSTPSFLDPSRNRLGSSSAFQMTRPTRYPYDPFQVPHANAFYRQVHQKSWLLGFLWSRYGRRQQ